MIGALETYVRKHWPAAFVEVVPQASGGYVLRLQRPHDGVIVEHSVKPLGLGFKRNPEAWVRAEADAITALLRDPRQDEWRLHQDCV